jgi:hypothetical protein
MSSLLCSSSPPLSTPSLGLCRTFCACRPLPCRPPPFPSGLCHPFPPENVILSAHRPVIFHCRRPLSPMDYIILSLLIVPLFHRRRPLSPSDYIILSAHHPFYFSSSSTPFPFRVHYTFFACHPLHHRRSSCSLSLPFSSSSFPFPSGLCRRGSFPLRITSSSLCSSSPPFFSSWIPFPLGHVTPSLLVVHVVS